MARGPGDLATVDTAAERAYALADEHRIQLNPRLPPGMIDSLQADLRTLGVSPAPEPSATAEPSPQAPSLAEALAIAANLVTAIHATVLGARAKPGVRKAYGATTRAPVNDVKSVLAAAEKIAAQATGNPSEALALGILPDDIVALREAERDLAAAETAARGDGGKAGATKREQRAAAARMVATVARIAGAGALAFAQNAAVRARFEALKQK